MKYALIVLLTLSIHAGFCQHELTVISKDSSVSVTSFINRSEVTDSIWIQLGTSRIVLPSTVRQPQEDCRDVAYKLVSDCAILNLPESLSIKRLDQTKMLIMGLVDMDAVVVKQMILVDLKSKEVCNWIAFFGGRGMQNFSYLYDGDYLWLPKEANQIYNDLVYQLTPGKTSFKRLAPDQRAKVYDAGQLYPFNPQRGTSDKTVFKIRIER